MGAILKRIETRDVLAFVALIMFFSCIMVLMVRPPAGVEANVLLPIVAGFIGTLGGGCVGAAFGFYFGQAKSASDAADRATSVVAPQPPASPVIVPQMQTPNQATGVPTRVLAWLFIVAASLAAAMPAFAQDSGVLRGKANIAPVARPGLPIDPLGLNGKLGVGSDMSKDVLKALDAVVLPDLKYALARAKKTNSTVTAPCYQAWIAIIEARQAATVDDQGNALPEPDPHLITTFEDIVELRNALQPDSDFMRACSPVANMVRMDILHFIGLVLGGGVGLTTLIPGL